MLVNGREIVCQSGRDAFWVWTESTGTCWVGNRPGNDRPFIGLVDDLRVSSTSRLYYPLDVTLPDPDSKRAIPDAWPYMRDAGDVIIHDDFEGERPAP